MHLPNKHLSFLKHKPINGCAGETAELTYRLFELIATCLSYLDMTWLLVYILAFLKKLLLLEARKHSLMPDVRWPSREKDSTQKLPLETHRLACTPGIVHIGFWTSQGFQVIVIAIRINKQN